MGKGLPPPGGDHNQAVKIITIDTVLISLSVCIVAVRFIGRRVGSKQYGSDDWTMLAALVRSLLIRTHRFSLTSLLRITTVPLDSGIRNLRVPGAFWLGETYLLLGYRTGRSI